MKKLLGILFLGLALTLLQSCSSTGVKDVSQLSAPSSTEANIYLKRTGGFVLGGTRAIIKIDGNEYGSLYPNDFLKNKCSTRKQNSYYSRRFEKQVFLVKQI